MSHMKLESPKGTAQTSSKNDLFKLIDGVTSGTGEKKGLFASFWKKPIIGKMKEFEHQPLSGPSYSIDSEQAESEPFSGKEYEEWNLESRDDVASGFDTIATRQTNKAREPGFPPLPPGNNSKHNHRKDLNNNPPKRKVNPTVSIARNKKQENKRAPKDFSLTQMISQSFDSESGSVKGEISLNDIGDDDLLGLNVDMEEYVQLTPSGDMRLVGGSHNEIGDIPLSATPSSESDEGYSADSIPESDSFGNPSCRPLSPSQRRHIADILDVNNDSEPSTPTGSEDESPPREAPDGLLESDAGCNAVEKNGDMTQTGCSDNETNVDKVKKLRSSFEAKQSSRWKGSSSEKQSPVGTPAYNLAEVLSVSLSERKQALRRSLERDDEKDHNSAISRPDSSDPKSNSSVKPKSTCETLEQDTKGQSSSRIENDQPLTLAERKAALMSKGAFNSVETKGGCKVFGSKMIESGRATRRKTSDLSLESTDLANNAVTPTSASAQPRKGGEVPLQSENLSESTKPIKTSIGQPIPSLVKLGLVNKTTDVSHASSPIHRARPRDSSGSLDDSVSTKGKGSGVKSSTFHFSSSQARKSDGSESKSSKQATFCDVDCMKGPSVVERMKALRSSMGEKSEATIPNSERGSQDTRNKHQTMFREASVVSSTRKSIVEQQPAQPSQPTDDTETESKNKSSENFQTLADRKRALRSSFEETRKNTEEQSHTEQGNVVSSNDTRKVKGSTKGAAEVGTRDSNGEKRSWYRSQSENRNAVPAQDYNTNEKASASLQPAKDESTKVSRSSGYLQRYRDNANLPADQERTGNQSDALVVFQPKQCLLSPRPSLKPVIDMHTKPKWAMPSAQHVASQTNRKTTLSAANGQRHKSSVVPTVPTGVNSKSHAMVIFKPASVQNAVKAAPTAEQDRTRSSLGKKSTQTTSSHELRQKIVVGEQIENDYKSAALEERKLSLRSVFDTAKRQTQSMTGQTTFPKCSSSSTCCSSREDLVNVDLTADPNRNGLKDMMSLAARKQALWSTQSASYGANVGTQSNISPRNPGTNPSDGSNPTGEMAITDEPALRSDSKIKRRSFITSGDTEVSQMSIDERKKVLRSSLEVTVIQKDGQKGISSQNEEFPKVDSTIVPKKNLRLQAMPTDEDTEVQSEKAPQIVDSALPYISVTERMKTLQSNYDSSVKTCSAMDSKSEVAAETAGIVSGLSNFHPNAPRSNISKADTLKSTSSLLDARLSLRPTPEGPKQPTGTSTSTMVLKGKKHSTLKETGGVVGTSSDQRVIPRFEKDSARYNSELKTKGHETAGQKEGQGLTQPKTGYKLNSNIDMTNEHEDKILSNSESVGSYMSIAERKKALASTMLELSHPMKLVTSSNEVDIQGKSTSGINSPKKMELNTFHPTQEVAEKILGAASGDLLKATSWGSLTHSPTSSDRNDATTISTKMNNHQHAAGKSELQSEGETVPKPSLARKWGLSKPVGVAYLKNGSVTNSGLERSSRASEANAGTPSDNLSLSSASIEYASHSSQFTSEGHGHPLFVTIKADNFPPECLSPSPRMLDRKVVCPPGDGNSYFESLESIHRSPAKLELASKDRPSLYRQPRQLTKQVETKDQRKLPPTENQTATERYHQVKSRFSQKTLPWRQKNAADMYLERKNGQEGSGNHPVDETIPPARNLGQFCPISKSPLLAKTLQATENMSYQANTPMNSVSAQLSLSPFGTPANGYDYSSGKGFQAQRPAPTEPTQKPNVPAPASAPLKRDFNNGLY